MRCVDSPCAKLERPIGSPESGTEPIAHNVRTSAHTLDEPVEQPRANRFLSPGVYEP